ncbi:hypothetical protein KC19_6G219400 [Ceratodon purpureus]|uniref:Uncharacterized protein n=1 Tax=Ceratodon purpureus TaxID=3225 RepID=A0A8T0HK94_CERPU|nr:hypothetical protein KC19_6G219400 [Ceratodon purpureus]
MESQNHVEKEENMDGLGELQPYSEFDPFNDVKVGHFVAMNSNIDDMRLGILFFLGKVKAIRNVSTKSRCMKVIWYWPNQQFGKMT